MVFPVSDALVAYENDAKVREGSGLHIAVGATILACVLNGLSIRIWNSIEQNGLLAAITSTFGISIIVWFSLYNAYDLYKDGSLGKFGLRDAIAIVLVLVLVLFPLPSASWVALSFFCGFYALKNGVSDDARRAFVLLLALSVSMQWGRWISQVFMPTILELDAALVSLLSGYTRHGNLVATSNGATTLEILEACSSFQNVSLAMLGWVNARCYFRTSGFLRGALFMLLMATCVVVINTARISLIAYRPDMYELIHGETGAFVASTLSTIAILSLAVKGARK